MGAAAQAASPTAKSHAPAREPVGKSTANKKTPAPATNPLWQMLSLKSGGASASAAGAANPNASPIRVQRKCAACEEEHEEEVGSGALQMALTIGPVDDPMEREADAVADRVMRKARGGGDPAPVSLMARGRSSVAPIRRVCKKCGEEERVQRKAAGAWLQRRCSKCDAEFESVQRNGAGSAAPTARVSSLIAAPGAGAPVPQGVREPAESVLNADLSGVRVHADARANDAAADINARAFTYGSDIYLGAGESSHDLGLMAHELTHTVQQGASPKKIQRFDLPSLEDVTGAVGDAVDSVVETGEEIVEGAGVAVDDAVDTVAGIAGEVWDAANALGDALGGIVSLSGGRLTINVPSFTACPTIPLQFSLQTIGVPVPILAGTAEIDESLTVSGVIYAIADLTPEISAQLGPCEVHGVRIVIDPLGDSYSISGWVTVTTAIGVGAEAHVAKGGQGMAHVTLPTFPPATLTIPSVNIEAGIALQARAIQATTTDLMIHSAYSGGTFTGALHSENDLGVAFDWGVGAFGDISVLGINLCRTYWPFAEGHWDSALHYDVNAFVSIGSGGFIAALSIGGFNSIPFNAMPVELNRDVLSEDCALKEQLCPILQGLGWMPSQQGGQWTGPVGNRWIGPLDAYPVDPGIDSKGQCRGACGIDCKTCSKPVERAECIPRQLPNGGWGHDWLIYPNYQECPSHDGCKEHDACYDWCALGRGPDRTDSALCRKLCDFQCMCNNPPLHCVSWIFGGKPHDSTMLFSDAPRKQDGCDIPCPEPDGGGGGGGGDSGGDTGTGDTGGGGSTSGFVTVCMPTLELFQQISDGDSWDWEEMDFPVWSEWITVPYVGLVELEITASAGADALVDASLGPGTMENVCFDIDPLTPKYSARGEIVIPARLSGQLTLDASLTAAANWFGVIEVVSATGMLSATGTADITAQINPTFRGDVNLGCVGGGKPSIETNLNFNPCLDLGFLMQAGFSVDALTFNVWSNTWDLVRAQWNHCWGEELEVDGEPGREPDLDLRSYRFSLAEIFEWLMSGGAEEEDADETPGGSRTVIEDPLTTATAVANPSPDRPLNAPQHTPKTLTLQDLGSGAATSDAGASMMTSFLTHGIARGRRPSGQGNLYGFEKLPTLHAHGGSNFATTQVFIRGHLLNHSDDRGLGGTGRAENLYPLTGQANNPDHNRIEEDIKVLVHDQRLVVMYGVNVTNEDGPHVVDVFGDGSCRYQYINCDFVCTYATYKLYDDNTAELNTPITRTVQSRFDRAGFISSVSAANCPER